MQQSALTLSQYPLLVEFKPGDLVRTGDPVIVHEDGVVYVPVPVVLVEDVAGGEACGVEDAEAEEWAELPHGGVEVTLVLLGGLCETEVQGAG